jgi:MoaA/NifB/PqqE/SkfB family radical SAM enzyme
MSFWRKFLDRRQSLPEFVPEVSEMAVVTQDSSQKTFPKALENRFCPSPWSYTEIISTGEVFVCCSAWTNFKFIGNIYKESPEEVWNSHQAVTMRAGILEGSFCECDHQKCPHIFGNSLPTRQSVRNDWYGEVMGRAIDENLTVLPHGPLVVKLNNDESCNLSCPSCRDKLLVATKSRQAKLQHAFDNHILPFLKDALILVLAGDGDPFGSHHYRHVMIQTAEQLPKLKIGLHTNAVLLDEKAWQDCRLEGRTEMVQVSVDASTEETYSVVRRGGDFKRLMKNLEFIAEKRRKNVIKRFDLVFVVQTQNFREMKDFVLLGKRLGVDSVEFMLIYHWLRGLSGSEYAEQKIWGEDHPRHQEFLAILTDPIFRDPIVKMAALDSLLEKRQLTEITAPFGEFQKR